MNYPSIRIEGSILTGDIVESIASGDRLDGQRSQDFGFPTGTPVKDEIADAWASARAFWTAYQSKLGRLREGASGVTETRNLWITPLLGMLGYTPELASKGEVVNQKNYAISHRDTARDGFPIHVMGWHDSLDKKRQDSGPRMSPHALVQEYINLTEHLYALVTNGRQLRLLRDSSRLIKLSFLEFDLERIFNEELFADFALLFRLLHASRMPVKRDAASESLIERYHQDALDSGSRIRDGLSNAVETCIKDLANGFLAHPANAALRQSVEATDASATELYQNLLRLIYSMLFLMVIEERGLVYPSGADSRRRSIYERYYSIARIRRLAEKRHFAEEKYHDVWDALCATFRLFAEADAGKELGIAPLGGLFHREAIGTLAECRLSNAVLLTAIRRLSYFQHPDTKQYLRVNYGALNVEEFGSVYEGLLEYDAKLTEPGPGRYEFHLVQGDGRASSGSHYTPDELVQPLLKHSIDYLIAERLKQAREVAGEVDSGQWVVGSEETGDLLAAEPKGSYTTQKLPTTHYPLPTKEYAQRAEQALLSLRIADIACGSGHILLAAARRIGTELATLRTGEDQPSPSALREAVRDVIRHCIYGVDLNPLAVELCKVALWLEAHVPGQPLNFLDHHIKCGNAIVGFVHQEELEKGIPMEAFKTLPGDDKEVAATLRKRNKEGRADDRRQAKLTLSPENQQKLDAIRQRWHELSGLPERTPAEIDAKRTQFRQFSTSKDAWLLQQIAAIPIAQFYQPKTLENKHCIITEQDYRDYLTGRVTVPTGQAPASAGGIAHRKKFFHWFLEFPEIIQNGGFDCILGNPPYLGGKRISGTFGDAFFNWVLNCFYPAGGLSDLVVYFIRRMANLVRSNGYFAFITTNTVAQGDSRAGGLQFLLENSYNIQFANRSLKWPGKAVLEVSLLSLKNGKLNRAPILNNKPVDSISSLLDSGVYLGEPFRLIENEATSFIGSVISGSGFILEKSEAHQILSSDDKYKDVIFPYLAGADLNSHPEQEPSRAIINFHNWPLDKARNYEECYKIVLDRVKPQRDKVKRKVYRENWWKYAERCENLYNTISGKERVMVVAQTSKTVGFALVSSNYIFPMMTVVFNYDDFGHFSAFQSSLHNQWAWKYASTLKSDLRYVPTDIAQTFPLPTIAEKLSIIGERYHEHRKETMQHLWLGLTKIYNLFHDPDLSPELVAKVSGKPEDIAQQGYEALLKLRELHAEMDTVVRDAYGWTDLDLGHGFHDLDYLPENDRTRYTISSAARKEVLQRLLKLNHERHAEELAAGLHDKKAKKTAKKTFPKRKQPVPDDDLFSPKRLVAAISLPAVTRERGLSDEVWWTRFVYEFINKAGTAASLPRLDAAWQLVVQRELYVSEFQEVFGDSYSRWSASLPQRIPNQGFFKHVVDLHTNGLISVSRGSWQTTVEDETRMRAFKDKTGWTEVDVAAALLILEKRSDLIQTEAPSTRGTLTSYFQQHSMTA